MTIILIDTTNVLREFYVWNHATIARELSNYGLNVTLPVNQPALPFTINETYSVIAVVDPGPTPPANYVTDTRTVNYDGSVTYTYRALTPEELAVIRDQAITSANYAVQARLDAVARDLQYDDMNTAITYVTSTNEEFQSDALLLRNWRDNVWVAVYNYYNTAVTITDAGALAVIPPIENSEGWAAFRGMILRRADAIEEKDPEQARKWRELVA